MLSQDSPVGIFDSGMGGLSVVRAMRRMMPSENCIYLGDTARIPYGPKSPETVRRYSLEAAANLVDSGAKAVIIACNTATVAALDALREAHPDIPVFGVVEPGARAAAQVTRNKHVGVIATAGTVKSGKHAEFLAGLLPGSKTSGIPCPLFVSLVEEGWMDGPPAQAVAERYLAPVFSAPDEDRPDTLILGCTHFPFLSEALRAVLGDSVTLVDPAELTIRDLEKALGEKNLLRAAGKAPSYEFRTTGDPERFATVGGMILEMPMKPGAIVTVDLGPA